MVQSIILPSFLSMVGDRSQRETFANIYEEGHTFHSSLGLLCYTSLFRLTFCVNLLNSRVGYCLWSSGLLGLLLWVCIVLIRQWGSSIFSVGKRCEESLERKRYMSACIEYFLGRYRDHNLLQRIVDDRWCQNYFFLNI